MEKYLFMRPVLRRLSEGRIFRLAFTVALRALAGVTILVGLVTWLTMWKIVSSLSGIGLLGGFVFQLLFGIAVYAVAHTILIRAGDVARLSESELTLLPIAIIVVRLIGEVWAAFGITMSIAGGILIWFAGGSSYQLLSGLPRVVPFSFGGDTFVGGLLLIVIGTLMSFFALTAFYWLAELLGLGVGIARNAERIRQAMEARETYTRSDA